MNFDIYNYDTYIVSFSGGKDSTACFLYLLDQGVPLNKIELWHQEVDGREKTFFDWEITPDYCRKFAEAFGVKIFFQWKVGGFKRELLKENDRTASTHFELTDGTIKSAGGTKGIISTRRKFPQLSGDLRVRWCSSYLKIDVCSTAIRNDPRFRNSRTLVISGERGEESEQRKHYAIFEPDKADNRDNKKLRRHVDRFRPIRDWKEEQVWQIIERYRVRVHPCYYMGWSRCSCKFCIFGNRDQFASAAFISPAQIKEIIKLERDFKYTMKRDIDLPSFISTGTPYQYITYQLMTLATSYNYDQPVILPSSETWLLPSGAYGNSCAAA